jgi:hypothetical protein
MFYPGNYDQYCGSFNAICLSNSTFLFPKNKKLLEIRDWEAKRLLHTSPKRTHTAYTEKNSLDFALSKIADEGCALREQLATDGSALKVVALFRPDVSVNLLPDEQYIISRDALDVVCSSLQ